MKLVWLSFYLQPVLIEQSILGFVVSAVHVLYNTGGPALVVILYCLADQV